MPLVKAREISRGDTIVQGEKISGVSRAFWNERGYNIAVENYGRERIFTHQGDDLVLRIATRKDHVS